MWHAYLFEAKSIQAYLFTTGRLSEIVGGSELVEQLTAQNGLVDKVLEAIGDSNGEVLFSRRGGGAFFAFSQNKDLIDKLAALWSFSVQQLAPGLVFAEARAEGESEQEAMQAGQEALRQGRQRLLPQFPQATPFALRDQRTGEAAVELRRRGEQGGEPTDAATVAKLKFAQGNGLIKRFAPVSELHNWPNWLNKAPDTTSNAVVFPFRSQQDTTIALVHADGNGLGEMLIGLQKHVQQDNEVDAIALFRAVSEAVSTATQQAAQDAVSQVLEPHRVDEVYPARPIVLGGDDLTMLVRADLALQFTRVFMEQFAAKSNAQFGALKKTYPQVPLPTGLTACAGIAYAKSSMPFHLLHGLAEDLCKHAKQQAKARRKNGDLVPSALAFHRVTTPKVDRYTDILKHELTVGEYRQTMEVYYLDEGQVPQLDDLLGLQGVFEGGLSDSDPRDWLSLLGDEGALKKSYQRWREVRDVTKLERSDDAMKALGINDTAMPFTEAGGKPELRRTPLGDLLTLTGVGNTLPAPAAATQVTAPA